MKKSRALLAVLSGVVFMAQSARAVQIINPGNQGGSPLRIDAVAGPASPPAAFDSSVLDRRYLAVDRSLHASLDGLELAMGRFAGRREILRLDADWERDAQLQGRSFCTVFEGHDGAYRAYYEVNHAGHNHLALAYSEDGLNWTKPAINGALEVIDHPSSNLINANGIPFYDPTAPAGERYKMLKKNGAFYAWHSADGRVFTPSQQAPIFNHTSDTLHSVFYDPMRRNYAVYGRHRGAGDWGAGPAQMRRGIPVHRSPSWTGSWPIVGKMLLDPKDLWDYTGTVCPDSGQFAEIGPDLYTPAVQQYHGQYIGLPAVYFQDPNRSTPGRENRWTGPIYPLFMHSSNGENWYFPDLEHPIIELQPHLRRDPHPDWPHGWDIDEDLLEVGQLYAANFIERDDRLMVYYATHDHTHNVFPDYSDRSFNVAFMRVDGFASLRAAGGQTGEWLTPVFKVPDGARGLVVNADVSGGGSLRAEVRDGSGMPLPGLTLDDAVAFTGNQTAARLMWGQSGIAGIAGQEVQLRFRLDEGQIYSFSFSSQPPDGVR